MQIRDFYYDNAGVRLHGLEGPDAGPPIVFLHGATGQAQEWLQVMQHLSGRWHTFALDLRGHGQSCQPADRAGYHMTHNVTDTLAFLRQRLDRPAVLVGHSYGAVTAFLSGAPGKDSIRALVLEDPPMGLRRPEEPPAEGERNGFIDYFSWVYEITKEGKPVDEIAAQLAQMSPQAPPETFRPWAENLAQLDPNFPLALIIDDRREIVRGIDFAERARGIACPVLLMQADPARGAALVDQDAEFLMANIPDVQRVQFPGAGHGIHTDQPDAFLAALDEFLDDLP